MCDSNEHDLLKPIKSLNIKNEKCKKCNNENGIASILLRNDDKPLCKECFVQASVHKFRSEFGKNQIIRQSEKVLVGFSGGSSSLALLEMIKIGLSETNFRKLRFIPEFIHIKEGFTDEKEVENILQQSGFKFKIIDQSELKDTRLKKLNDLLLSDKTATSKQAVKLVLLKDILTKLASEMNCSRLLLANSCTRLSILTLSNLAQGLGSGSAEFVGFNDDRFKVSIIQPLRQFSIKEISYLNHFLKLKVPVTPNEETCKRNTYSFNKLTEDFISSLTTDYPATIFTISRTAAKIHKDSVDDDFIKCIFCRNAFSRKRAQFNPYVASASNALYVANLLLQPNSSVEKIHQQCQNRTETSAQGDCDSQKTVCYTCQWLLKEIDSDLMI